MSLGELLRTREFRTLAPVALVAGCLAVFIELAEDLLEGETHGFDTALLLMFRTADPSDPIGPRWLEVMMSDITSLGGYAVLTLLSVIAMGYLCLTGHRLSAWLVAASGLGALGLNQALKIGFDRPRPDLVSHLAEVHTLSFPSGHAMLSAVVYLTLGVLLAQSQPSRVLKIYSVSVAVLVTVMVGVSRIYLGVHWPSDVFAGWSLGAAWAISCLLLVRYLAGRERLPRAPLHESLISERKQPISKRG